jgi:hypothetical protein
MDTTSLCRNHRHGVGPEHACQQRGGGPHGVRLTSSGHLVGAYRGYSSFNERVHTTGEMFPWDALNQAFSEAVQVIQGQILGDARLRTIAARELARWRGAQPLPDLLRIMRRCALSLRAGPNFVVSLVL